MAANREEMCFAGKGGTDEDIHTVRVWVDRSARYDADRLLHWLGPEERVRCAEFRNVEHRRDYIVAHALKRLRIARSLGADDPAGLRFGRHASGKPYLLDAAFYFNLSHSHGRVALAMSCSCECAVDIEAHRSLTALDLLIKKAMTPAERALIEQSQSPHEAFFDRWVIKEAFVKVSGVGLREPFDTLCTVRELAVSGDGVGTFGGTAVFWHTRPGFSLAACGIGKARFVMEGSLCE